MSSFAAFLAIQGVRYPLLTYSLAIHQQTDSLGRPASPTQGGTIDCTLNVPTTDRSAILRWMLSPTAQLDGEVLLMQDVPRTILKSIAFFNAYCVGLTMHFRSGQGGGGSLQLQVRISPQRVAVGSIVHDNNWPVESHGAGETFAKPERQVQKQERQLTSEDIHGALDKASYVPYIGLPAGITDTALYLKEGNWEGAAIAGAGVVAGLIPFGKLIGKGAVVVAKLVRRTKIAKQFLKNILNSRALAKRVADRIEKIVNKKIIKLVNAARKTKWARRITKNILALRNLKSRIENRLIKSVDKGVERVVKLVRKTGVGRRLTKNAIKLRLLKDRLKSKVEKIVSSGTERIIKVVKRNLLAKKLIENISNLKNLVKRVKDRMKNVLTDSVEAGVDLVKQTAVTLQRKFSEKEANKNRLLPEYETPMNSYSMNPKEVKRVLDAVLAGKPYNKDII